MLMKAGITARRRSYSLLAYYIHGPLGKLAVDLGMIGLQLGTLIAQIVVIGDLGPALMCKTIGIQHTPGLRSGFIAFLCIFVGLPFALLKDLRALSKASAFCMLFYVTFSIYVVLNSIPNLVSGNWYKKVNFWRSEGFFQCLPIFSFAFGCQTQLFITYDSLSEPSLKRMDSIVSAAVNMCTVLYLLVGFFGYIAYSDVTELSGDIINHFEESSICDCIKLCFVISIAVSIPLIVFPCRASMHTLLFPLQHKDDLPGHGKIPELHFKLITVAIMFVSMVTAILIPNIEFVLGLNGATTGSLICYIFPALFFINIMSDSPDKKSIGKIVLVAGLTILILSTYTTLTAQKSTHIDNVHDNNINMMSGNTPLPIDKNILSIKEFQKEYGYKDQHPDKVRLDQPSEKDSKRQEPPVPQEPSVQKEPPVPPPSGPHPLVQKEPPVQKEQPVQKELPLQQEHWVQKALVPQEPVVSAKMQNHFSENDNKQNDVPYGFEGDVKMLKVENNKNNKIDILKEVINDKVNVKQENASAIDLKVKGDSKESDHAKLIAAERKQEEVLEKLEKQQIEQKRLIDEQKEILQQLKEHQGKHMEVISKVDVKVDANDNIQQDQGKENRKLLDLPIESLSTTTIMNETEVKLDEHVAFKQKVIVQNVELNQQQNIEINQSAPAFNDYDKVFKNVNDTKHRVERDIEIHNVQVDNAVMTDTSNNKVVVQNKNTNYIGNKDDKLNDQVNGSVIKLTDRVIEDINKTSLDTRM